MINKITCLLFFVMTIALVACKKEKTVIPPTIAEFTATAATANYFIQNTSNSVYKIPVGFTTPSNSDRKVTYTVTSPSGATAGTQYNIVSSGTITIPAGKTVDSINVNGLFAGFPGTRKDTLVFKITGGDGTPAIYANTFTLVLQKSCPVNLSSYSGVYTRMNDNDGSPLYTASVAAITAANQLTSTTGYIMVTGLWGVAGSGPIRVNLDWTDPGNLKTDIPTGQPLYVNATYGQAFVRPSGTGSFSSCDNTFTLKYQVYVSAGSFTATTTSMAR